MQRLLAQEQRLASGLKALQADRLKSRDTAIMLARKKGALIVEARRLIPPKAFTSWRRKHRVSRMHAWRLRKLAERWDDITTAMADADQHGIKYTKTIAGLVGLVRDDDPEAPPRPTPRLTADARRLAALVAMRDRIAELEVHLVQHGAEVPASTAELDDAVLLAEASRPAVSAMPTRSRHAGPTGQRPRATAAQIVATTSTVRVGDSLTVLKDFPANHFDCCVTSPPYFFVRDYGHDDQIGMERTPQEYVSKLVAVFDEVHRVLKPTGTLWLNIGDNYCTRRAIRHDGKRSVVATAKAGLPTWKDSAAAGRTISSRDFAASAHKEKDLFGVPQMVATALRERGWYLRADIIWVKPIVVPERAADRPARSYEHVFLLTKEPTGYVWNAEALAKVGDGGGRRPARDVWEIAPSQFRSGHTAVMPEELAARCILAGSPVDGLVLDPFGGTGTTGLVARLHGRSADVVELNPEFAAMARNRIAGMSA